MNVPENLFYTKEHEWVKIDGKTATVGITDHAQSHLGDITYIELPKTGAALAQFKAFATVESVKAASDVYAPMSGRVVKVNEGIKSSPETVNKAPYEEGWFVAIEISNEGEKAALMDPKAYAEYLKEIE